LAQAFFIAWASLLASMALPRALSIPVRCRLVRSAAFVQLSVTKRDGLHRSSFQANAMPVQVAGHRPPAVDNMLCPHTADFSRTLSGQQNHLQQRAFEHVIKR
jgi:hypothetical protein